MTVPVRNWLLAARLIGPTHGRSLWLRLYADANPLPMPAMRPRRFAALLAVLLASLVTATPALAQHWVTTAPAPSQVTPDNTYLVSGNGATVSRRSLEAATAENDAVNAQVLAAIEAQRNARQGVGPATCDRIESAAQRVRCGK